MGGMIAGGLQLLGSVNAAYDESQAAKRTQLEAQENKQLALSAAADAIARGNRDASFKRLRGSQVQSEQQVAYSGSGVDSKVGTAADVQGQSGYFAELDARTEENNAAAEAWGFRRHGLKYQAQAQLDAARSSAKIGGTILSGAGGAIAGASRYFSDD